MSKRLAVITSQLGTASETFIRRHVVDLLPDNTVAIARHSKHPFGGRWESPCPVLFLDEESKRFRHRLGRRLGFTKRLTCEGAIKSFLHKHDVGLVLGEYLDQFVEFVPLLNQLGIPYVVQGHGIDVSAALRDPNTSAQYQQYRSAKAVLTRCEFHRQRLINSGLPAELIQVNPGGIDIPAELTQRSPDARKRFLAVGRMVPKKGPIYLLEAFRRASLEDPAIRLDYIGDGEMFPAVKQFVDAMGLSEQIRLHGVVSEERKQSLWLECGNFLQHSVTDPDTGDEEGLPAAIQEAMACGMVVISTTHSGIPEAIEDGVTGHLVAERDVSAMKEAILRVANADFKSDEMVLAAYRKAAALYSWPAERGRILSAMNLAHHKPHHLTIESV